MRDLKIFFIILFINFVVTVIYLLLNILRRAKNKIEEEKNRHNSPLLKAVVMLLCPIVGPGYFFISWVLYKLFFHKEVDLTDVVFSKDRIKSLAKADEEREINIVPLEEAIAVTDSKHLRNLMMDVVKGDVSESLPSIAKALNAEDSETSHYAASVLQGELNNFRARVAKDYKTVLEKLEEQEKIKSQENKILEEELEDKRKLEDAAGLDINAPSDKERVLSGGYRHNKKEDDGIEIDIYITNLLEYINKILEKNIFTSIEQNHFSSLMDEIGEKFYEYDKEKMQPEILEKISLRLLDASEFNKCEKWCLRLAEMYPDTLAAYTSQLKLYFTTGRREKFFEIMDKLKSSEVVIDKETLELIRVFS